MVLSNKFMKNLMFILAAFLLSLQAFCVGTP